MKPSKPIALLTSKKLSKLIDDESHLVSAFSKKGHQAVPAVWSEEQNWSQYSTVLIRNPWDYFEHQEAFFSTLKKIDSVTRLLNSYPLVKWNIDKNYLFELEAKGAAIPLTVKIRNGDSLKQAIENFPHEKIVIKPLISAGAYQTYLFDKTHIPNEVFELPISRHEFMLQPFLKSVQEEGELSFIYFGGIFSHAVVKQAAPGDFRVQAEFGGTLATYQPTASELKLGDLILSLLPLPPHYARIDLARNEGKLVIMEVELIEPELFFRFKPESAQILVDGVMNGY